MNITDIKHRFNNIDKLYHYTTFDKAIRILQSRTLLFGRLKDMNDINELYRPLAYDFHPFHTKEYPEDLYIKMKEDLARYQQISLTRDWTRNGFDIPAMWGHYANKGNGVCFVFDKNILINTAKEAKGANVICETVHYTKDYSPVIIYRINKDGGIIPFNRKEEKDYFYHKTKDWQYEQEFRIVIKSDSENREKLNIGNTLVAIIMHNAESVGPSRSIFDSLEYEILNNIKDKDIPILEHNMWFNDTQLTIHENTIWTSNPIDWDKTDICL